MKKFWDNPWFFVRDFDILLSEHNGGERLIRAMKIFLDIYDEF